MIKRDAYSRQETIRSICSDLCDTTHLAVKKILRLIGDKIQKVTTPQYTYQKSYAICRSSFINFIKTNLVVLGSARLLYSFKRNVYFQLIIFQPKTCIYVYSVYSYILVTLCLMYLFDRQRHRAFKNVLFQNTMGSFAIQMIIYSYSIWLKSAHTSDNPLEAIKPHPIWSMFVENKNRESLQLKNPQPLPANKWPNNLLMNFTQLRESCTQASRNI